MRPLPPRPPPPPAPRLCGRGAWRGTARRERPGARAARAGALAPPPRLRRHRPRGDGEKAPCGAASTPPLWRRRVSTARWRTRRGSGSLGGARRGGTPTWPFSRGGGEEPHFFLPVFTRPFSPFFFPGDAALFQHHQTRKHTKRQRTLNKNKTPSLWRAAPVLLFRSTL
jgi:hypothetical protein